MELHALVDLRSLCMIRKAAACTNAVEASSLQLSPHPAWNREWCPRRLRLEFSIYGKRDPKHFQKIIKASHP